MDNKITETVFDEAIQWAVTLRSGTVSADERAAFTAWLQRAPAHKTAWRRLQEIDGDFSVAKAAAGPARATLDAVRRERRKKRRAVFGGLTALALMVGAAFAGSEYRHQWTADVTTGTAEQRTLEIAGGGRIHVNGRTSLDLETTAQGTMVRLRRGVIVVQSGDAGAPIAVATANGTLRPVGTRYVVSRKDGATGLAVIAGTVAAASTDRTATQRVGAGTEVRVADGEIHRMPRSGLRADAWVDGTIEADDAALGDVLDGLSPHLRGWLLFDDEVAALRVSGVFRLDDTDRALAALERVLPVEIDRMTGWIVRIRLRDEK